LPLTATTSMKLFSSLFQTKLSSKGLGLFRIAFGILLLSEGSHVFEFQRLIFDDVPYLSTFDFELLPLFSIWIIALTCFIIGLKTRTAAIVSYAISLFIFNNPPFECHMHYAYLGLGFLFIFLPLSKSFSVDRILMKIKYSNLRKHYIPSEETTLFNYLLIILTGLGFFYFDSVLFKITSNIWMSGLGVWYPGTLPQITTLNDQFLLDQEWLMKGLSWVTVIFESVFIFLFWFRRFRVPLLIIGLGLHLGILIKFPIPYFSFGYLFLYILMVPPYWWISIAKKFKLKKPLLKFYYDEECPLCLRTVIIINSIDIFGAVDCRSVQRFASHEKVLQSTPEERLLADIYSVSGNSVYRGYFTYAQVCQKLIYTWPIGIIMLIPGISHMGRWVYSRIAKHRFVERCTSDNCYVPNLNPPPEYDKMTILKGLTLFKVKSFALSLLMIGLILLQLNVSIWSPAAQKFTGPILYSDSWGMEKINGMSQKLKYLSVKYFGITHHPVFMDFHFKDLDHVIGLTFEEEGMTVWLPITTRRGLPGEYLKGDIWVNWNWRVVRNQIDKKILIDGLEDYTAFWLGKNGHDFDDAHFKVKLKEFELPDGWEKGFLTKALENEWQNMGEVSWQDEEFVVNLSDELFESKKTAADGE
jgi:predicted DCC family thiol-disulfide oxidoreductase YuxK